MQLFLSVEFLFPFFAIPPERKLSLTSEPAWIKTSLNFALLTFETESNICLAGRHADVLTEQRFFEALLVYFVIKCIALGVFQLIFSKWNYLREFLRELWAIDYKNHLA